MSYCSDLSCCTDYREIDRYIYQDVPPEGSLYVCVPFDAGLSASLGKERDGSRSCTIRPPTWLHRFRVGDQVSYQLIHQRDGLRDVVWKRATWIRRDNEDLWPLGALGCAFTMAVGVARAASHDSSGGALIILGGCVGLIHCLRRCFSAWEHRITS